MFGGNSIPFSKSATGYDSVSMTMRSDEGYVFEATRAIEEGKTGDRGSSTVTVSSSVPGIDSDKYKVQDYSNLLLKLLGIDKSPQIISTERYATQALTIRTIFHFFFLDEDHIIREKTALDTPEHSKITASMTALYYFLTENNLESIIPKLSDEEIKELEMQKTGVINYISKKIKAMEDKRGELESILAQIGDIDVEGRIDAIVDEISSVEREIIEANNQSRKLLEHVYSASAALEEARFLQNRYRALQSQYQSDIKRLEFIIDSDNKDAAHQAPVQCPFCDHDITNHKKRESFIASSREELTAVQSQLIELAKTQKDTDDDIVKLEEKLRGLNAHNESVQRLINGSLKPHAAELKEILATYRRVIELKRQMLSFDEFAEDIKRDSENQAETEEKAKNFNPRTVLNKDDLWRNYSQFFGAMVKACAYPNCMYAGMSIDTYDAVVNSKFKKDEGKGYRAFLNTIVLFSLMKYLEQHGKYAPRLLILDSPILSLKEKKQSYGITEAEKASPGMRVSLFKYMIENCGSNQVIIAENEIPDSGVIDYGKARIIEFTLDESTGRFGFLRTNPQGNAPQAKE